MLINVVGNAIKFTKKGLIAIVSSYDPEGENLHVTVQDSGAGIAIEDIPFLFAQFGKLHRTAKMNSNGIGLGLTIVKNIITQLDGTVEIKSDGVGKGTTVVMQMKLAAAFYDQ